MRSIAALIALALVFGCSRHASAPAPPASASTATVDAAPPVASLPDAGMTASSAASTVAAKPVELRTTGEPFGLRFDGDGISFCDRRGGHRLDLRTGLDRSDARECQKDEPNTACNGLGIDDVSVSTPNLGPEDRIQVGGHFYWPGGRVHDCAADGKTLAVVTGVSVVRIDSQAEKSTVLAEEHGDRVAISAGWIAWTNGSRLRAVRR